MTRLPTLVATFFLFAAPAFAAGVQPNIIFIVADDLGYGDVGFNGGTLVPTPHLDSIAANGVRCASGYVTAPICSPTRAGLMTGRYQQRFGHEQNQNPPPRDGLGSVGPNLDPREVTLPQRLRDAGYATGMIGKWHLGTLERPELHPTQRGFQELYGFNEGLRSYLRPLLRESNRVGDWGTVRGGKPFYLTDALGSAAADYVKRHAEQPFFLYVAFNAVHTPMEAVERHLARVAHVKEQRRRTYAAMLCAMDDAVGTLFAQVKASGLEERTFIAFISDNGGAPRNSSSNAPLRATKYSLFEGGIRVPFVVQWKGRIPAGTTFEHPVISLDLTRTALALAGVEVKPEWQLDGVDLTAHLTGERKDAPHEHLYWRVGPQMAVRGGDWKLVKALDTEEQIHGPEAVRLDTAGDRHTDAAGSQLFNLRDDLSEKRDLAATHPEIVQKLTAAWEQWNATLPVLEWSAEDEEGVTNAEKPTDEGKTATPKKSKRKKPEK